MPDIRNSIESLIEDIGELRSLLLADEQRNSDELRSLLRRMFYQADNMQRQPFVSTARHQKIVSLLATLLDAEHGALLRGATDKPLGENESAALDRYIAGRKLALNASGEGLSELYPLILRCSELLGKTPAAGADLALQCSYLELSLREHLQDDAALRRELNQLTSAFEGSLDIFSEILKDVGDDAPELRQVKEILKQELPADPKKAHELLQHARESLLQAGSKLSHATTTLKGNMQKQMTQVQALSKSLADAESQARCDPLTGLANRRKLAEFLAGMDRSAEGDLENRVGSFIMLDIDHFKAINDRYGHDAGDKVLTMLARLLTESVRQSDMVARLGGEEFCVVLPGMEVNSAFAVAEKLREAVALHPFQTESGKVAVTISLGVAPHRKKEPHVNWIKRADQALYQSKEGGRNRTTMIES